MLTTAIIVVASDRVKAATVARKLELACSQFGGSSVCGSSGSSGPGDSVSA